MHAVLKTAIFHGCRYMLMHQPQQQVLACLASLLLRHWLAAAGSSSSSSANAAAEKVLQLSLGITSCSQIRLREQLSKTSQNQ
jgi:hypothetical protein